MTKKRIYGSLVIFIILTMVVTGCSKDEDGTVNEDGLEETKVILDWTPNTNHTGLYVALEKGFYEDEGLDVDITQPADGSSNTLIATEQGDFGVSYQEDLTYALTTDDPLPIKAIAAVIQDNTSGFASRATAGIETVKDFENKVYGGWGSPSEAVILDAVMSRQDADADTVQIIDLGVDDFFAATEKNIDLIWIFEAWTGIEAEIRGVDINYIPVKDLHPDLNYYTPILITNNKLIDEDPEKISKFLRATSKGYEYAMENPEESAKILLKYAPELDEELVMKSQEFLADEYQKDAPQWGLMKEEVWQNYTDFLMRNDLLENELKMEDAFTNEFLEEK